jgi:DNA-binding NarL/FixJ family response regulator
MKQIRVLIADDHVIVRSGLRSQLEINPEFDVAGEAADGQQTVSMAKILLPDIILMDIAMPNLNGIQATSQLIKSFPKTGIIMLSMHSDEAYLIQALAAGARGYLLKDTAATDLCRAIRSVAQGKLFFSPVIANMLVEDYTRQIQQRGLQDAYDLLTKREREVLQLVGEGKSDTDISGMLNLSTNSAEIHRTRIMQKLNLHCAAEIVLYAVRKRIVS